LKKKEKYDRTRTKILEGKKSGEAIGKQRTNFDRGSMICGGSVRLTGDGGQEVLDQRKKRWASIRTKKSGGEVTFSYEPKPTEKKSGKHHCGNLVLIRQKDKLSTLEEGSILRDLCLGEKKNYRKRGGRMKDHAGIQQHGLKLRKKNALVLWKVGGGGGGLCWGGLVAREKRNGS